MELPTLPAEHGHSLGVRRRVERSFPAVRAAVGLFEVTKVALDRKFGERVRRTSGPGEEAGGDGRERYVSVPDFLLFQFTPIGGNLRRSFHGLWRSILLAVPR